MSGRRMLLAMLLTAVALGSPTAALAAPPPPAPAWNLQALSAPSHFRPGHQAHIWVADTGNDRVQKWLIPTNPPTYSSSLGSAGTGNAQFNHPGGMAVDAQRNLWVADTNNDRVEKFNENGEYLAQFGSTGSGNGQLSAPKVSLWIRAATSGSQIVGTTASRNSIQTANSSASSAQAVPATLSLTNREISRLTPKATSGSPTPTTTESRSSTKMANTSPNSAPPDRATASSATPLHWDRRQRQPLGRR